VSASPQYWVDAQLSPALAQWLRDAFGVDAVAIRDLGFRDAEDSVIFRAARDRAAIVVTKDNDFVQLLDRYGAPPQVLWLTCGNTSNTRLRALLGEAWPSASTLLAAGEPLVEISDPAT
jgi:predicted nuclease of predicted toxin-antitoxin system